jgi:hypothetical protein
MGTNIKIFVASHSNEKYLMAMLLTIVHGNCRVEIYIVHLLDLTMQEQRRKMQP